VYLDQSKELFMVLREAFLILDLAVSNGERDLWIHSGAGFGCLKNKIKKEYPHAISPFKAFQSNCYIKSRLRKLFKNYNRAKI